MSKKFLTKDEELHYGGLVQSMVKAKEELKTEGITNERKAELQKVIKTGDRAVEVLVEANKRLVYKRAHSFKESYPGGPELDDLIQDGMTGLMNSILRYDPKRNNKLSTVATYWIFQSITRQTNKVGRLVRLPENRINDFSKISKMRKQLELSGVGASDADEFIKEELNLSNADFSSIVSAGTAYVSLNMEVNDKDSNVRELIDVIPVDAEKSVEEHVIKDVINNILDESIEKLTDIQREVLNAAFYFEKRADRAVTTKEVKERYQLSNSAFSSILSSALKIVKEEMDSNGISYADFLDN